MANISYKAIGRKNSKKNPAMLLMNIDGIEFTLTYTKKYGWALSEDASVEALNAFCKYITLDHEWRNAALQDYINGYFNSVTSWNPQAASLNWVGAYSTWKYVVNKDAEIIVWNSEK